MFGEYDIGSFTLSYIKNDVHITEELLRKQFMEEKEMVTVKRITLIGAMSDVNKEAMISLFNRLTWRGNVVNLPYLEKIPEDTNDEQIESLHTLHENKMISSDLIIVVDADGHVGKDTQREIDWCYDHGKNLIFMSDMQVRDFDHNSWLEPNCHDNVRPSAKRNK